QIGGRDQHRAEGAARIRFVARQVESKRVGRFRKWNGIAGKIVGGRNVVEGHATAKVGAAVLAGSQHAGRGYGPVDYPRNWSHWIDRKGLYESGDIQRENYIARGRSA